MQIIAAVMAIVKAVPVIDKWLEQLFLVYSAWKKEQQAKQAKAEIDQAIENQDQRRVENENHSGVYSGRGDIRSSLPNVVRDSEKN